jgi:hypothetical protein
MSENRTYVDIFNTIEDVYTLPLRPTGNYINRGSQNNIFSQLLQSFLQPVEIYPTQSQIEAATRRVRYSDITRPVNSQCPITMDSFNDNDMVTIIRHCGHIFNTENINNWFRSNCRCPVCRHDIREFNSNTSTEYFNNPQYQTFTNNNNNNNNNNNIQRMNSHDTIPNLYNSSINRILDPSGNHLNNPNEILASYVSNVFNTQQ